jgi:hypothetical protein
MRHVEDAAFLIGMTQAIFYFVDLSWSGKNSNSLLSIIWEIIN